MATPAIACYNASNTSLVYRRATDASGTTWGDPITLDADGDVGQWASMAVVDGKPAIAYYDVLNGDLKYIIANDVNGDSWGTPVVVGGSNNLGKFICLKVVNGNPAVSYVDVTLSRIRFCRANDATGSSWGTKVNVSSAGLLGLRATSLEVVNSYPAIAYLYSNGSSSLKYVRAADSNGTSWGTTISPATCSQNAIVTSQICRLTVVNGHPAIMYYGNSAIKVAYVRASDSTGATWGSYVDIDATNAAVSYGNIAVVNDTPMVIYGTYSVAGDLYYARATDGDGTAWGTPAAIDATGDVGGYNCLAIVNGNPAASYYDYTNFDLKYVRASNVSGTAWGTPVSFSAGSNTGQYTSFTIANNNPAMSFYDQVNGDLKYVRASNTTGTGWGGSCIGRRYWRCGAI